VSAVRSGQLEPASPEGAITVGGPYYEELRVGQVFDTAPGLTLTEGHAALHQAILGDRLVLPLDADLCLRVVGQPRVAHPGLVCDVAIGQSTMATQRVIANLFYRGLVLRRSPVIGDTLRTTTEIVALRDTSARPNRPPVGLVALRVRTVDQLGRDVLDYHRCAMLPMRDPGAPPGHADDLDAISAQLPAHLLRRSIAGWDLAAYRELGPRATEDPRPGDVYLVEGGDTVTAAPELARMTLNIASAHHDPAAGGRGRRLVYGGHTIGLAASHVTRALPGLLTIVAWRSCDHLAPVYEGDVLRSTVEVVAIDRQGGDGALIDLHVKTSAERLDGGRDAVLDWRPIGALA
jgi:acyl dehydratase